MEWRKGRVDGWGNDCDAMKMWCCCGGGCCSPKYFHSSPMRAKTDSLLGDARSSARKSEIILTSCSGYRNFEASYLLIQAWAQAGCYGRLRPSLMATCTHWHHTC